MAQSAVTEITEQKIKRYLRITAQALKKAKITLPKKTALRAIAEDYYDMASRYYHDAEHFFKKKNYVLAFAAINYAHGWLDAGARIGLFDVRHDSKLFTVDDV